jgi:hypothetical protein
MLLYFSFNLTVEDNSGLPFYSQMFIDRFKDKEIVVINIIANPEENKFSSLETSGLGYKRFDCCVPNFLNQFSYQLFELIKSVIDKYDIKKVVIPDHLIEDYVEKIDLRSKNIKKVLFIHLLYAGLTNVFMHEPYFNDHLASSMIYLGSVSHKEWKAIVTSDIIICNSKKTEADLRKYYSDCSLDTKEIYAIPLGINKNNVPFQPALESKKWAYFGRLDSMKGLWYISKDFVLNKELYQENPPIIMGDGMLEMLFMKAHFFEKIVDYRGLQNKASLYEILKDVKYCIFPSIYEPWGLALTEALAMGKICIISKYPSGMHEQVKTELENGFVFDFKNNSIVNFIKSLNNNAEVNNKMEKIFVNNARKNAMDINVHFEQIEKILF